MDNLILIGLGQNNGPCVLSGSHRWRSHVCCAIYHRLYIPLCVFVNVLYNSCGTLSSLLPCYAYFIWDTQAWGCRLGQIRITWLLLDPIILIQAKVQFFVLDYVLNNTLSFLSFPYLLQVIWGLLDVCLATMLMI